MLKNFTGALAALLLVTSFSFAQTSKYNVISKSVLINVDGGLTLPDTDYKTANLDYFARTSIEYFFPSSTPTNLGIRLFGTLGFVSAEDNNREPSFYRTNISSLGGGLIFTYSISDVLYPYFFGGASLLSFNPKGSNGVLLLGNSNNSYNNTEINYLAEFGFKIPISSNMKINIGGNVNISPNDYIDDINSGKHNDIYYSAFAGLSFALFAQYDSDNDGVNNNYDNCPNTPQGVMVNEYGCPIDTDKDGVADYLDICASTPIEVKVDKNGCPLDSDGDRIPDYKDLCEETPSGITVDEYGCPFDMDSDGVYDYVDKCLGTPIGVEVDSKGCPLDDDLDGVPNYKDKCLDSKPGEIVDEYGCLKKVEEASLIEPVKEVNLSANASFGYNSATLMPSAFPILDELYLEMLKDDSRWRIEGHTDNVGSDEGNIKIATMRAESVLHYFLFKGMSKDRFEVVGLGKQFPVADNNTELGRSKNRRVTIFKIK